MMYVRKFYGGTYLKAEGIEEPRLMWTLLASPLYSVAILWKSLYSIPRVPLHE
jgi:hypothetical protein